MNVETDLLIGEALLLGVPEEDTRRAIECGGRWWAPYDIVAMLRAELAVRGSAAIIDTIVVTLDESECERERVALDQRALAGLSPSYADAFAMGLDRMAALRDYDRKYGLARHPDPPPSNP